jgi:hypothetical protein
MRVAVRESSCRATQLLAFRTAAIETWGELGWSEACERLDAETREALLGRPIPPVAWVPERYMLALADAVFTGPASSSEAAYREFVRNQVNLGFGRVRRFLLHLAPPERVLSRAPELWRHDHTHGELVVDVLDRRADVRLVDHDHATTAVARLTAAEIFRCVLSLTRAKNVRGEHRRVGERELHVRLDWGTT